MALAIDNVLQMEAEKHVRCAFHCLGNLITFILSSVRFFIEYAVSQDAYIKCNLLDLPYPHINWNVRIGGKSVMGIDSKIWNESTTNIMLNKTFFIV